MNTSLNVASHLVRMAAEHPTQVAVYAPRGRVRRDGPTEHRAITFRELNADSDAIAHGLASVGVARGTRTALMVPPSPDFFALTFALFKVGAVPVLIDPGMGVRNLGKCLAEAGPEAFVGVAKAHAARRVLGWAKGTVRATVNVSRWRFFCDTSLARVRKAGRGSGPYPVPDSQATEPAAVLFTSGSTGVAKGVVYVHGIFDAQVKLLKATYGIAPGEIDLCTFPLFALFGPALGMTCVIPDMDASRPARLDPHKAAAQIKQFGVTSLFGSPAVIRRLGELTVSGRRVSGPKSENSAATDLGPETRRLETLKRVISAGAPASAASLERFVRLLPDGVEVFTPYGATEALPVANIGSREILGETRHLTDQGKGVCVGRPVQGVEVRVIRISDQPIAEWDDSLLVPPGEVGEFVVRGPVVTQLYYNRPDATRLAKIRDPKTGEVLHRMGDVGYFDAHGRLWFCGRKSHRVVTPHGTLFTDMVEPVFNTVPGVARTALVGVTRGGATHPVLCVEFVLPQMPHERRFDPTAERQLRAAGARSAHTRGVATFLEHDSFPMDVRHNSKIFREKLAVWADKLLGPNWSPGEQA
ncbi:fatty acid CoA ligase family protein [Gemmata sp. JC717]|uniref:fatty acid CoA ligase family protein n=1 Tax=Gemmata algarum TaxID=2975278 RepID=UPI0021BB1A8C|nr:fatty acid CoA ligase family protein [Gemmata algarum]MDY3550985.1 fatty acid CoA ligase family protein [Gemmata algarum]